jgi:hypothetical protein
MLAKPPAHTVMPTIQAEMKTLYRRQSEVRLAKPADLFMAAPEVFPNSR